MPEPLTCPECAAEGKAETFSGPQAPMLRGRHRRVKHGVVSGKPKSKGKRKDRAPRAAAKPRQPSLKADLRRVFKVVGTIVSVADPYCGTVLVERSGDFCDALAALAAHDPRIARWLAAVGKAGPYGALFLASAELAVPIGAHHGLVPPGLTMLVGIPPPPSEPQADVKGPPEAEPWPDGEGREAVVAGIRSHD